MDIAILLSAILAVEIIQTGILLAPCIKRNDTAKAKPKSQAKRPARATKPKEKPVREPQPEIDNEVVDLDNFDDSDFDELDKLL